MGVYTKEDLTSLKPTCGTFVGVDSDGCVFDTMDVKQKAHFHPLIVKMWNLEKIEPYLRRAAEFVNLYSKWRGQNRFPALLKTFRLLEAWPEVLETGVKLPNCTALEGYINSGLPLGNPSLSAEVERAGDPELKRLLDWSLAVNADIAANMAPVPPFNGVRESLEKMTGRSDVIVVSQTPEEALVSEWREHGIDSHIRVIAGQELGTKSEHLRMATEGRYELDQVLMIGDAPGDRRAAESIGALFFPINPGHEEDSWRLFGAEAYDAFLDGKFAGEYQARLIDAFEALLPEVPPWETGDRREAI